MVKPTLAAGRFETRVAGAQEAVDDPGLAPDLAHDPAHIDRDIAERNRRHPGAQQAISVRRRHRCAGLRREPGPAGPQHQKEEREADRRHDAERIEEQRQQGRLIGPAESMQADHLARRASRSQARRARPGIVSLPIVTLLRLVGPGE